MSKKPPTPASEHPKDKTDWKRIEAMTDDDIALGAAKDPDARIPPDGWWKDAKLVLPQTKEVVTMRLDRDVAAWFRGFGRGYQTRINAVLRAFMESHDRRSR